MNKIESFFSAISQKTKLPINLVLALSFFILAGIGGVIYYSINNKLNHDYLDNPKEGDLYSIDVSVGSQTLYTLYKVKEVKNDTVYVLKSQYQINKLKQVMQLEDKPYERIVGYYLKTELRNMFEKGTLKDINR